MTKQEEIKEGQTYCQKNVECVYWGKLECPFRETGKAYSQCTKFRTTLPTKQEEIREGMWEFILEIRQYLCNTEFAPEPFTAPVDLDVLREMGNTQLKKMDSQGVVIGDKPIESSSKWTNEEIAIERARKAKYSENDPYN